MLTLGRKVNESIRINDDITITIVRIQGSRVTVGVSAPRSIPVHRQEVYEQHKEAKRKQQEAVQDAEHEAGTDTTPATDGLSYFSTEQSL